jgi:sec-independent protein translocase protein TatB
MLSVPHLIIIFLVALVVFGPEKLPELARNFGKVMAEFRRATGDLRSTFEEHMRDLEREADDRRIDSGRTDSASRLRATGGYSENAPANVVPTTPLSSRGTPELSAAPGDESNDPSEQGDSRDRAPSSYESAAAQRAPSPPAETAPDPAASPPPSSGTRGAQLAEAENTSETPSDGHSSA